MFRSDQVFVLDVDFRWQPTQISTDEAKGSVLLVASTSSLDAIVRALATISHGRRLLVKLEKQYGVILGVQLDNKTDAVDSLISLSDLAAALGEETTVDVILARSDLSKDDMLGEPSRPPKKDSLGNIDVVIRIENSPISEIKAPSIGKRDYLVQTASGAIQNRPLNTHRRLLLPVHDPIPITEMFRCRPITLAIEAWLDRNSQVDQRGAVIVDVWRERNMLLISEYANVNLVKQIASVGDFDWIVVQGNNTLDPNCRDPRFHVLTLTELEAAVDDASLDGADVSSLAEVLLRHPHTTVVEASETPHQPLWLAPGELERRLVVNSGKPVFVVPTWRDVSADLRLMAASTTLEPQPTTTTSGESRRQFLSVSADSVIAPRSSTEIVIEVGGSKSKLDDMERQVGLAVGSVNEQSPMHLKVTVSGSLRILGEQFFVVPIQDLNRSQRLLVEVVSSEPGRGRLSVALSQGPIEVAEVDLVLLVSERVEAEPQIFTSEGATHYQSPRRNQIFVARNGNQELTWNLAIPSVGIDSESAKIAMPIGLNQMTEDVLRRLSQVRLRRLSHGDAMIAEIRGLGCQLVRDLFPAPIRETLSDYSSELDGMEIHTEQMLIPWELCCFESRKDSEPLFLADVGLTRRFVGKKAVRKLLVGNDRRYIAAPSYESLSEWELPRAAEESKRLQVDYGFKPSKTDLGGLMKLLVSDSYDVLHFAGHGIGQFGSSDIDARLILDDSEAESGQEPDGLRVAMVQNLGHRTAARHPVIFLNACESGRQAGLLNSFPSTFMQAGAGAVIGSQWAVEDSQALKFAETFYSELLDRGESFSEAIKQARSSVARRSLTRLAYVAYGDPDAKVNDSK